MTGASILVLFLLLGSAASFGEPALKPVSIEQFRADVARLRGVVAGCAANAAACDPSQVGDDERVGDPHKPGGFAMHWDWLREALKKAQDAKPAERGAELREASTRLEEIAQDAGSSANGQTGFTAARAQANTILARREFQAVTETTWWDRAKARFFGRLGRLIEGIGQVGKAAPWIGTALLWLLFVGAAVGLLFFALRSFNRQRLRVSLSEGAAMRSAWDIESADWARLAEQSAAAGEWREAVHGLYWAAIVHLEARRAWRHNPARTPREYVRLLKPGSAQQGALRGLTQIFERVWYGFAAADDAEYGRARTMFDGLAGQAANASEDAAKSAPAGVDGL